MQAWTNQVGEPSGRPGTPGLSETPGGPGVAGKLLLSTMIRITPVEMTTLASDALRKTLELELFDVVAVDVEFEVATLKLTLKVGCLAPRVTALGHIRGRAVPLSSRQASADGETDETDEIDEIDEIDAEIEKTSREKRER
ncbi:hypothetical protein H109_02081 [Trichophyton interdigitale MR816]|uniref:Uncharacterized protein n=1 Tax=Trichophyton interdigitale (strain MR816) TaxID=1215338 RepID=A0A059JE45_TRIIM|nr:hypothetical protein H101_06571 [Trichophyton interdigitale H6]KDB26074.1 hypothetical protein H109_02081 [Trichophyton interdigitale MR816]